MLLGCGLFDGGQVVQEGEGGTPPVVLETPTGTLVSPVVSETPKGTVAPPVETKTPTGTVAPPGRDEDTGTVAPPVETKTPASTVAPTAETKTPKATPAPLSLVPPAYDGPTSLEERIFASPIIARVRLDSASSVAESGTIYDGKYIALLEFSFSVQEYLKGSGADDIVAVWAAPYLRHTPGGRGRTAGHCCCPGRPVGRPGSNRVSAALRNLPPEHAAGGTLLSFGRNSIRRDS